MNGFRKRTRWIATAVGAAAMVGVWMRAVLAYTRSIDGGADTQVRFAHEN